RVVAEKLSAAFQERGHVLPRLRLTALQHVMARCSRVVAMDSLPLHLCATTKTPSLSFFGPSSKNKYCPSESRHISIQGECPFDEKFEKRCPKLRTCKSGACINEISADALSNSD
ncbi:MAG: glycosyltransferase family 9 protein, partial [Chlamydiales bacterium]